MITLDIRRWGVWHLVGTSAAYWTALAAATLTPLARAVIPLAVRSGLHGSVSASAGEAGLVLSVMRDNIPVYTSTTPLLDIALWIAVPPLALWLGWLAMRPSRTTTPAASHGSSTPHALGGAMPNAWSERAVSTPSPIPAERRENRS